jgi:hypothetical protein
MQIPLEPAVTEPRNKYRKGNPAMPSRRSSNRTIKANGGVIKAYRAMNEPMRSVIRNSRTATKPAVKPSEGGSSCVKS